MNVQPKSLQHTQTVPLTGNSKTPLPAVTSPATVQLVSLALERLQKLSHNTSRTSGPVRQVLMRQTNPLVRQTTPLVRQTSPLDSPELSYSAMYHLFSRNPQAAWQQIYKHLCQDLNLQHQKMYENWFITYQTLATKSPTFTKCFQLYLSRLTNNQLVALFRTTFSPNLLSKFIGNNENTLVKVLKLFNKVSKNIEFEVRARFIQYFLGLWKVHKINSQQVVGLLFHALKNLFHFSTLNPKLVAAFCTNPLLDQDNQDILLCRLFYAKWDTNSEAYTTINELMDTRFSSTQPESFLPANHDVCKAWLSYTSNLRRDNHPEADKAIEICGRRALTCCDAMKRSQQMQLIVELYARNNGLEPGQVTYSMYTLLGRDTYSSIPYLVKSKIFNDLQKDKRLPPDQKKEYYKRILLAMIPPNPTAAESRLFCSSDYWTFFHRIQIRIGMNNCDSEENRKYLSLLIKNFVLAQVNDTKYTLLERFYELVGGEPILCIVPEGSVERMEVQFNRFRHRNVPSSLLAFFIKNLSACYESIKNKPEGYDPIYLQLLAVFFNSVLHERQEFDLIGDCAPALAKLTELEGNSFTKKVATFMTEDERRTSQRLSHRH